MAKGSNCGEHWNEMPGVKLDHFLTSTERRTFTYCKPLVLKPGESPCELNRLDSKNWTPTPRELQSDLATRVIRFSAELEAIILLDQVDVAETGVATTAVANTVHQALARSSATGGVGG